MIMSLLIAGVNIHDPSTHIFSAAWPVFLQGFQAGEAGLAQCACRSVGGREFSLVHNGAGPRCERVQARLAARAKMVYSSRTLWVGAVFRVSSDDVK
jgi:hypothetical protein